MKCLCSCVCSRAPSLTKRKKKARENALDCFSQDLALVEAAERHRANEGGFRFETSAQLKEVEDERIRLEKERRVSTFSGDRRVRVHVARRDGNVAVCGPIRPGPCWRNPK